MRSSSVIARHCTLQSGQLFFGTSGDDDPPPKQTPQQIWSLASEILFSSDCALLTLDGWMSLQLLQHHVHLLVLQLMKMHVFIRRVGASDSPGDATTATKTGRYPDDTRLQPASQQGCLHTPRPAVDLAADGLKLKLNHRLVD